MIEFRILGPLEVLVDGRAVAIGGARQRALLCHLLVQANEVVSADRLVDQLWPGTSIGPATNSLHAAVSRLRSALAGSAALLETRAPGYVLRIGASELDAIAFTSELADARSARTADLDRAAACYERALECWRGAALADVVHVDDLLSAEAARLDELRLTAVEERLEVALEQGRHGEILGELLKLVPEHPLRERLVGLQMLALYRAGRQAEALDVYQTARGALVEGLGIEPGPALRRLERQILEQDSALGAAPVVARPTAPAAPAADQDRPSATADDAPVERRVVTVLFADLSSFSELAEAVDPERLREFMAYYYATCRAVLDRHGATIEKFIGDAVLALFGLPRAGEDDALRATRAAVELRDAVVAIAAPLGHELGLRVELRIGLNTGEVVAGGPGDGAFVTGAAVNVAKRLEEAAQPGQILAGPATHALVAHAVDAQETAPLALKGSRDEVRAWSILTADPAGVPTPRHLEIPLVGRQDELARLTAAFDQACAERSCIAVTLVGPAGIGKSRLVRELESTIAGSAHVAAGRCLSYGEGVTYWPIAEALRRSLGDDVDEPLHRLLHDDPHAGVVAERVLAAIGAGGRGGPVEETHWAIRRTLEAVARQRPLVLVLDDVHWAEPALLDLVDYLCAFSGDAPLLVVCVARPELRQLHPTLVAVREHGDVVALGPLPGRDTEALIDVLAPAGLPARARARIVEAAEGNPLFIEQMVAIVSEHGEDAPVPPSIQALLSARLDALPPRERVTLARASIEGKVFHRGAVAELAPAAERDAVWATLLELVRKELIAPASGELPGEDAFRFRHILIREAAYSGLAKDERASLHERFAAWLDRTGAGRPEQDEFVGFHLEQAWRYTTELGRGDSEPARTIGRLASSRLAAAGRSALAREETMGAAALLGRAAVIDDAVDDPALLLDLGLALTETGKLDRALEVLGRAREVACARSQESLGLHAEVLRLTAALQVDTDGALVAIDALAARAERSFGAARDELALCRLLRLIGLAAWVRARAAQAERAWVRASASARRAGARRELLDLAGWRASAALWGPTPVDEAIALCRDLLGEVADSRAARVSVLQPLAALHAMAGDHEIAREHVRACEEILDSLGRSMHLAVSHAQALVEQLAGDLDEAERLLREGYERLDEMGERAILSGTANMLARVLAQTGRVDEAARYLAASDAAGAAADALAQLWSRGTASRLHSLAGEHERAAAAARDGAAIAATTDFVWDTALAFLDLAAVLEETGSHDEACTAREEASALLAKKGVQPSRVPAVPIEADRRHPGDRVTGGVGE